MLTTSCIMCGDKISWNAFACPHCGDPGPELRKKLRNEKDNYDGMSLNKIDITQHLINGFFNFIIGGVILFGILISFYLMSSVLR